MNMEVLFDIDMIQSDSGPPRDWRAVIETDEKILCQKCGRELIIGDWARFQQKIGVGETESHTLTGKIWCQGCDEGISGRIAVIEDVKPLVTEAEP